MSTQENGSGCDTIGEHDGGAHGEGEHGDDLERIERTVAKLENRVAELEAATQALRGYAGSVRRINRDVEQRADRALATAERLERRLDEDGGGDDVKLDLSSREQGSERN